MNVLARLIAKRALDTQPHTMGVYFLIFFDHVYLYEILVTETGQSKLTS